MSSQARCAIAPFLAVETLDSPFSRIQIQKTHVNAGSRRNGFLSNENKIMRFSELHPPTIITMNKKLLQLTPALHSKDRTHFVSISERFIFSNFVYVGNSRSLCTISVIISLMYGK